MNIHNNDKKMRCARRTREKWTQDLQTFVDGVTRSLRILNYKLDTCLKV